MNIQAINLKSTQRRRHNATQASPSSKIYIVGGFLLFFIFAALLLNYRTWLNKNIAQIDKQTSSYRRKIHELKREIENLRIRKESLSSWPHIRNRIVALRLNLKLPSPAQVEALVVNFDEAPADTDKKDVRNTKIAMASYNR